MTSCVNPPWSKFVPHDTVLITCFALTLLAVTAAGAAEHPTTATSEPLPPSPEGSVESDDKPGERGATDGPDSGPGGPGGFGGPDEPGYGIAWYPSASVAGQGTKLGIVRNHLGVDVPVWVKGADTIMVSFSVDESHFSGKALLPDTLRAFPSDLWRIQAGLKHMHQFTSGASSTLMFDIDSASDKPFHSSRDVNYTVGGFFERPVKNGRDSWQLGAMYSPLGSPNFPIPLVAYNWHPSKRFHLSVGLPLSMNWQPTDKLNLDLSYDPWGVDGHASYQWSDRLRTYGGYHHVSDPYFLSDRVNKDDAFFAIENRLIVGLRRDVWKGITLDLHAGYAFDRHYGEGDDDEQDLHDRVNLESSGFLGARLILEF